MITKNDQFADSKDITLRDVVVHMQNMEQRLSSKIDENTQRINENTHAIQNLEIRIDVLKEDLTATIKDTIKIRKHVGIASVDDDD